tara:strand:+ start:16 stop:228 length:213 start_codon:yes stop_codon:yes gene_type:complete
LNNIGGNDRIYRAIASVILLCIEYLTDVARFEYIFFGIAIFGIFTSSFGFCPFYKIVGVSTCQVELNEEE